MLPVSAFIDDLAMPESIIADFFLVPIAGDLPLSVDIIDLDGFFIDESWLVIMCWLSAAGAIPLDGGFFDIDCALRRAGMATAIAQQATVKTFKRILDLREWLYAAETESLGSPREVKP